MPTVLYVCHNHPVHRPGGAEIYATELFEAIRSDGSFEPLMVARAGPPVSTTSAKHAGTRFALLDDEPGVYLFYTDRNEIDLFFGSAPDKRLYSRDWRGFLEAVRPDVVHFQHTLLLGYDLIRETRQVLDCPIVYTLHEFLPICHHSGQMVQTETLVPCDGASPQRCHRCFPRFSADMFLLRERTVKAALEQVDAFIAPSRHLADRFIAWGVPETKLVVEDYGRLPLEPSPDPPQAGRRRRVGFFGQITRFKGVDLLLEAVHRLEQRAVEVDLQLNGANLAVQPSAFQESIEELLQRTAGSVTYRPGYARSQLPQLMTQVDWVVVPSLWWENSPLVIQEAFMSRRPVITADIGGMAEKVRDGVDGLHFVAGEPDSLAETIERAVTSPDLWDLLRSGITNPRSMDAHVVAITDLYNRVLSGQPVAAEA